MGWRADLPAAGGPCEKGDHPPGPANPAREARDPVSMIQQLARASIDLTNRARLRKGGRGRNRCWCPPPAETESQRKIGPALPEANEADDRIREEAGVGKRKAAVQRSPMNE